MGIYFLARQPLGLVITTWLCVIGVVPFAAVGFIKYNGMTAEQFAWAYLKSKIIFPYRYLSTPRSIYYDAMEENIAIRQEKAFQSESSENLSEETDVLKRLLSDLKRRRRERRESTDDKDT